MVSTWGEGVRLDEGWGVEANPQSTTRHGRSLRGHADGSVCPEPSSGRGVGGVYRSERWLPTRLCPQFGLDSIDVDPELATVIIYRAIFHYSLKNQGVTVEKRALYLT